MNKNRLEAFSDGVMAIIITIMVLELKVPHGTELKDIQPLVPTFFAYVLSFIYVGIYWNNHHHLFQSVSHVNGAILWANLFLLFCLSLLPFATGWMGENHLDELPVFLYGLVLFMACIAWWILVEIIIREKSNSKTAEKLKCDPKIRESAAIYLVATIVALFFPIVSCVIYALVALLWFIPDKRMEKAVKEVSGEEE
ncbi:MULTISPECIES: TMEM175 family protein [unclassified Dysgonomonas]|uniref:TMEM175 family protein n=1 Tax=unclassified Dysgonomonas TaxID=2630389 RepID=UPI0013EB5146|nr:MULTISPECIES: TMEM175 family protein [unclassified Dysgonomonas]